MKYFEAQKLNTPGVIARVTELFKGHRELIRGFNDFLPKGFEMRLSLGEDLKRHPMKFDQAMHYVKKIKTRFINEDHIYKAFSRILNMYVKGDKSVTEAHSEVAALFRDHHDLLDEFVCFIPDSIDVSHPSPRGAGVVIGHREDKPLTMRLSQAERPIVKEQMANTSAECVQSSEKTFDRDRYEQDPMGTDKEQFKRGRDSYDEKEQRQAEKEGKDHSEKEGDGNSDASQRLPNNKISARRAEELIGVQSQAIMARETITARTSGRFTSSDKKKVPKGLQRKLAFFENVKSKLPSQETYQQFLKCLKLYSEETITREQLHSMVDGPLSKFPDLVEGFNDFLSHCESIGHYLSNHVSKKLGDGPDLKQKVEQERETQKGRKRCIEEERIDHARDSGRKRYCIEEERIDHEERRMSSHEVSNYEGSSGGNRIKYATKPIPELDLSNCEQGTPSYRLLPKEYPKPVVSHRKPSAQEVLNDTWVSVACGYKENSYKHRRRDRHEENLFRCEDDQYELDVLLESTAGTARRMESLLEKLQETRARQDSQLHVDDYLSAINIRCIERIYGDDGLDVVDHLRKDALGAIPVILPRLKQKCHEWRKCKEDMDQVWAEIYAKSYHKSLDCWSSYSKEDKKSLSIKKIKKITEKKQKDDGSILSIAAGDRKLLNSDFGFEYPEPDVNDNLYELIKLDEMCSSMEISDKVMHLWTAFSEPISGMPSRSHSAEDAEEVSKGKSAEPQDTGSRKNKTDKKEEKGLASEVEIERAGSDQELDVSQAERSGTCAAACKMDEGPYLPGVAGQLKIDSSMYSVSKNDAIASQLDQMHVGGEFWHIFRKSSQNDYPKHQRSL
ncbi:hypothetical protein KP509_02G103500 [Ceratopteris richardii]|nr:hypothetical protein KP509_02G103500 [Ceratopteris richardii]